MRRWRFCSPLPHSWHSLRGAGINALATADRLPILVLTGPFAVSKSQRRTPTAPGSDRVMARGRKPSGRTASAGHPNPIDIHVGGRVRLRRTLLGMRQEKLAEAIGLTFQQVQKYERGANRIGSSRLFDLARVLDVTVAYFFEDMSSTVAAKTPSRMRGFAESKPEPFEPDPMARRETLELVRAYYRIVDPQVRKRVFELAKTLGKTRRVDA